MPLVAETLSNHKNGLSINKAINIILETTNFGLWYYALDTVTLWMNAIGDESFTGSLDN